MGAQINNYLRHRKAFGNVGRPASLNIVEVSKGMQADEPHLPAYDTTKWCFYGGEVFGRPTTDVEALWQVKGIISTLELGASVKVNDGAFLRPSYPRLLIDASFQRTAYWETRPSGAEMPAHFYPCKPAVYDAWFLQEFKLAVGHHDARLVMMTFKIHYEQIDARMRAGRECPATYIQAMLDNVCCAPLNPSRDNCYRSADRALTRVFTG